MISGLRCNLALYLCLWSSFTNLIPLFTCRPEDMKISAIRSKISHTESSCSLAFFIGRQYATAKAECRASVFDHRVAAEMEQ